MSLTAAGQYPPKSAPRRSLFRSNILSFLSSSSTSSNTSLNTSLSSLDTSLNTLSSSPSSLNTPLNTSLSSLNTSTSSLNTSSSSLNASLNALASSALKTSSLPSSSSTSLDRSPALDMSLNVGMNMNMGMSISMNHSSSDAGSCIVMQTRRGGLMNMNWIGSSNSNVCPHQSSTSIQSIGYSTIYHTSSNACSKSIAGIHANASNTSVINTSVSNASISNTNASSTNASIANARDTNPSDMSASNTANSNNANANHSNANASSIQRMRGPLGRVWGKISNMHLIGGCRIDSLVSMGSGRGGVVGDEREREEKDRNKDRSRVDRDRSERSKDGKDRSRLCKDKDIDACIDKAKEEIDVDDNSKDNKHRELSKVGGGSMEDRDYAVSNRSMMEKVRGELSSKQLKIDDFIFLGTVGTGSFGRVCIVDLIHSSSYYPPMALKILSKYKVIAMKQVEHVKDERRILAQINHPFIVNLLAAFQDERRLFLLMEYVGGGELFSYLRRQPSSMCVEQARLYTAEITLALEYLHARSIVYRDLKPENLLIDGEGHIKLTDFGFAKVVEGKTWTLCGTHEYLAPESITRRGHGLQVDWWALGILLFELLVGRPPFVDDTPLGIYKKIIAGKVEFPPLLDSSAKSLIKRLLVHEPNKRYGCLRDGPQDVKNHKFFKSIDWMQCLRKQIKPVYVPHMRGPRDTSLFDSYAESTESSAPPIDSDTQSALFLNF